MQTLLHNLLIDAIPNNHLTKLWDPYNGYHQSTFQDVIFHIFNALSSLPKPWLMKTKLFDKPIEVNKLLTKYIKKQK